MNFAVPKKPGEYLGCLSHFFSPAKADREKYQLTGAFFLKKRPPSMAAAVPVGKKINDCKIKLKREKQCVVVVVVVVDVELLHAYPLIPLRKSL